MSILENKKIIVKPIVKDRPFFKKGHDGEFMFTGCFNGFKLPYTLATRSYANIFGDGEQTEFEKLLNKQEGALSIFDWKNEFWNEFTVELDKNEKTLDLNIPIHALEYRVLKANKKKIALDEDHIKPSHLYLLVDSESEKAESYKMSEKNEEAMELFMKIRKSDKKMYDLLRILGKKPSLNMKSNTKALKAELDAIIALKKPIKGQPNIDDFIKAANDPKFSTKVFVLDAIELGEVTTNNGGYRIKESKQLIGNSLDQAVDFFDSAKNQDQKLLIEQRLELNK